MDKLKQFVRGVMKTACDPYFGNTFHSLLKQIEEVDVRDFGIDDNQNLVIEVPISFFASRTTGYRLKFASLGGFDGVLNEADTKTYKYEIQVMRADHYKNKCTTHELRIEQLEEENEELMRGLVTCNESLYHAKPNGND